MLPEDTRVFEIRTYHANPGKMEALNTHMREKSLPLFKKHGLSAIGFWIPKDRPNTLIYILAFEDMEAHDKALAAFFSDPAARQGLEDSEKSGPLLSSPPEIVLACATDYSPLK